MPKSKRDKKVSLTQTKKKGLELKQRIIEKIRNSTDVYPHIFTFSIQNMRNCKLKDLRQEWRDSRFYFGKNRVMALALGRSREDEHKENLHLLSKTLRGQTGLLFTKQPKEHVLQWFNDYSEDDFARSGAIATHTVVIDAGPLKTFPHSMEPYMRKLGLPTSLKRGVVTIATDHTVCECGAPLTPEQATLLKLFGHKMATFKLSIESMWSNDGQYEVFKKRKMEKVVMNKKKIVHLQAPDEVERMEDDVDEEMEDMDDDDE